MPERLEDALAEVRAVLLSAGVPDTPFIDDLTQRVAQKLWGAEQELARLRAAAERVAAEARATALEVWRERDEARGQAIAARAGWDACVSTRAMLQAEVERLRALLAAAPGRGEDQES